MSTVPHWSTAAPGRSSPLPVDSKEAMNGTTAPCSKVLRLRRKSPSGEGGPVEHSVMWFEGTSTEELRRAVLTSAKLELGGACDFVLVEPSSGSTVALSASLPTGLSLEVEPVLQESDESQIADDGANEAVADDGANEAVAADATEQAAASIASAGKPPRHSDQPQAAASAGAGAGAGAGPTPAQPITEWAPQTPPLTGVDNQSASGVTINPLNPLRSATNNRTVRAATGSTTETAAPLTDFELDAERTGGRKRPMKLAGEIQVRYPVRHADLSCPHASVLHLTPPLDHPAFPCEHIRWDTRSTAWAISTRPSSRSTATSRSSRGGPTSPSSA